MTAEDRDRKGFLGVRPAYARSGGEMLRTTLGLLITAPEGIDVSYKYEGEGTVDGYPANIIFVEAPGTSFKLFLDASTNLPRMISYTGHSAVFFKKSNNEEISKEEDDRDEKKGRDAGRTPGSGFPISAALTVWCFLIAGASRSAESRRRSLTFRHMRSIRRTSPTSSESKRSSSGR